MKPERVYLSIDGDHACALLGSNLQEGEAEFVKVENLRDDRSRRQAALEAFDKLTTRLGIETNYEMGEGLEV